MKQGRRPVRHRRLSREGHSQRSPQVVRCVHDAHHGSVKPFEGAFDQKGTSDSKRASLRGALTAALPLTLRVLILGLEHEKVSTARSGRRDGHAPRLKRRRLERRSERRLERVQAMTERHVQLHQRRRGQRVRRCRGIGQHDCRHLDDLATHCQRQLGVLLVWRRRSAAGITHCR